MRVRYHDHGQITEDVRQTVERLTALLDTRLSTVDENLTRLDVTVERHLRDGSFTAELILELPGGPIIAKGDGDARETAIRRAYDDIVDELETRTARQHGQSRIRREEKFHRDAAELAREETEVWEDWPDEPPRTEDEAVTWGKPTGVKARQSDD
jgi:ribosome-associated translation inhibitor RaiA